MNTLVSELRDDPLGRGYAAMGTDDHAIVASLNAVNRTRSVPTEIGIGTVLAVVGAGGGAFLDRLVQIGESDRNVYWAFKLIERGVYRIDMPASRAGMQALAIAVPDTADAIAALLALGVVPCSRAEELGLGRVDVSQVWRARERGE